MKIILSRKGFDSSSGKMPSPILPDGTLVSLPIPRGNGDDGSPFSYDEIMRDGCPLSKFVEDLSKKKISGTTKAHLDPDLDNAALTRLPGWRPAFGQSRSSQMQLVCHNVGLWDLFLFFGWFRQVELVEECFRFKKDSPDLHVLFGWLQVDEVLPLPDKDHKISALKMHPWLKDHPHVSLMYPNLHNTLYIAREDLTLPGLSGFPGGGFFRKQNSHRILTAPDQSLRSLWALPGWFFPPSQDQALSYHKNPNRWKMDGKRCLLKTVGRGQEFVLDVNHYPKALEWAASFFA